MPLNDENTAPPNYFYDSLVLGWRAGQYKSSQAHAKRYDLPEMDKYSSLFLAGQVSQVIGKGLKLSSTPLFMASYIAGGIWNHQYRTSFLLDFVQDMLNPTIFKGDINHTLFPWFYPVFKKIEHSHHHSQKNIYTETYRSVIGDLRECYNRSFNYDFDFHKKHVYKLKEGLLTVAIHDSYHELRATFDPYSQAYQTWLVYVENPANSIFSSEDPYLADHEVKNKLVRLATEHQIQTMIHNAVFPECYIPGSLKTLPSIEEGDGYTINHLDKNLTFDLDKLKKFTGEKIARILEACPNYKINHSREEFLTTVNNDFLFSFHDNLLFVNSEEHRVSQLFNLKKVTMSDGTSENIYITLPSLRPNDDDAYILFNLLNRHNNLSTLYLVDHEQDGKSAQSLLQEINHWVEEKSSILSKCAIEYIAFNPFEASVFDEATSSNFKSFKFSSMGYNNPNIINVELPEESSTFNIEKPYKFVENAAATGTHVDLHYNAPQTWVAFFLRLFNTLKLPIIKALESDFMTKLYLSIRNRKPLNLVKTVHNFALEVFNLGFNGVVMGATFLWLKLSGEDKTLFEGRKDKVPQNTTITIVAQSFDHYITSDCCDNPAEMDLATTAAFSRPRRNTV